MNRMILIHSIQYDLHFCLNPIRVAYFFAIKIDLLVSADVTLLVLSFFIKASILVILTSTKCFF